MTYTAKNQYQHTCRPTPENCTVCGHDDAAERASIMTEGQDRSAYERAVALILESRRRGQRVLLAG